MCKSAFAGFPFSGRKSKTRWCAKEKRLCKTLWKMLITLCNAGCFFADRRGEDAKIGGRAAVSSRKNREIAPVNFGNIPSWRTVFTARPASPDASASCILLFVITCFHLATDDCNGKFCTAGDPTAGTEKFSFFGFFFYFSVDKCLVICYYIPRWISCWYSSAGRAADL